MSFRALIKKFVISIQVRYHIVGTLKWRAYRIIRRIFRRPHLSELKGLSCFSLDSSSLFLDIGANLGQTIDTVRLYTVDTPIISFEPNPFLASVMQNLYKEDRHVTVEACGLGGATGTTDFFIPCYNGYVFNELASLRGVKEEDWFLKKYIWKYQGNKYSIVKQAWKIHRLDDFNLEPFIIKADAQGMEIEIVRGGLSTISKCKPIILLKGVRFDGELREMLEPLGYRMYAYRKGGFVLQNELTWNAFFITEDKFPRGCIAPGSLDTR